MSISHARWESQFGSHIVGFFTLHVCCVVALSRIVLLTLLVKENFTCDAITQLFKYLADAIFDIVSGIIGDTFDFILAFSLSQNLSLLEFLDGQAFSTFADVDELVLGHVNHHLSVLEQRFVKVGLQREHFFFEQTLSIASFLDENVFLPHPHKLPFFELLKERKLSDVFI